MIYVKRFYFEVKWSYGEVLGNKNAIYSYIMVTLLLRVLDCIVTISFGVYLVLWVF